MTTIADTTATDLSHEDAITTTPTGSDPWWTRNVWLASLLLVTYLLCSLATDPGGYLGSDTGGKAATVAAMADRGDLSPDVGYWAEDHDPDGSLHPMWKTMPVGDQWIQATTLPMLHLATPLWRIGGYRAALLLPMLGAIAAALASGEIARLLGHDRPHRVVLVVGLASAMPVYALDLWEHSLGVGLMTLGAWGVLRCLTAPSLTVASATGICFGLAATMRSEALVFGLIAGIVLTVTSLRERPRSWAAQPTCMAVAGAATLLLGVLHEQWAMGTSIRAGRTAATPGASGFDLESRLIEALITFAGPTGADVATALILGLPSLLGLGLVAVGVARRRPRWRTAGLVIWGIVTLSTVASMLATGLGFVPGLIVVTPLAGVGMLSVLAPTPMPPRTDRLRLALWTMAAAPLPLVWATQYVGFPGPQWGGRYILTAGILGLVLGLCHLDRIDPRTSDVLIAGSAIIAVIGVSWLAVRSHRMAGSFQDLAGRPEPVLVFSESLFSREAGPVAMEGRWLAAITTEQRTEAAGVLGAAGIDEFGYVHHSDTTAIEPAALFPGFEPVRRERMSFILDDDVEIITYRTLD